MAFFQHDNASRYACTEENPRRQADNGIDIAIFQQVLADCPLCSPTEQDAMRQDNAHGAVFLQMVKAMEQEGKIRL